MKPWKELYHLLRVEKLAVSASPDLVNHGRFKVHKHSSWNMLASASLREESRKGIILGFGSVQGRKGAIVLQAMLHTIELPAGIAHLDTSLTNMYRKAFPHLDKVR